MRRFLLALILAVSVLSAADSAEAGIGQALAKGAQFLGRQVRRIVSEGAESGVKQADSVLGHAASKTAGKVVSGSSVDAGKQAIVQLGKGSIALGRNAADEILAQLGPSGVRSMTKLSPVGASRLAEVSAELAKSPHRAEWLRLIGKSGDAVATFLWNRKGSVAIAAAAGAVVLAPSDFVQATEGVVTSTISTVGTHVIEPLVVETARHVAGPVATEVSKQAAASLPWTLAWCLMFASVAGGLGYRGLKRRRLGARR